MEPNLPELPTLETSAPLPTFTESKYKETLQENLQFIKNLFYLTKKVFML